MSHSIDHIDSKPRSPDPFASPHDLQPTSSGWVKFKDSFKPAQESTQGPDTFLHKSQIRTDTTQLTDVEKAAFNSSNSRLKQRLTLRHLLMVTIGATVGTGLFVNCGTALSSGGPASLVIGWVIVATMIFATNTALGEMGSQFPVTGGFITYTTRFVDPSVGFAMGWTYAVNWLVALPLELVGAAITIRYWRDDINADVWVAVFYVAICALNLLSVHHYAESEVLLSAIKLLAVVGFFILGIVLVCGGGPEGGYIGGKYWHNPGAFSSGFKGVCSVFVTAAFSFAGIELLGVTAAETENPRVTIPSAAKRVFWIITISYLVTLILVGCLVPYDDDRLLNGDSYASVSPLVIAIQNAGIKGLPSLMNVIILLALISVANSSVYASSRVLAALADIGHAPKFLAYVDRNGRPLYATIATFAFGLLAFLAASSAEGDIFLWFSALTSLATIFAWISICLSHIRFRFSLNSQGRSTDELTYVAHYGYWGSMYGVGMNILVVMGQFWVALFPGASADAESFFEVFLSLLIFIVLYLGHKIWKRNWSLYIKAHEMDIDTGRKRFDTELLKQEIIYENEMIAASPLYYRLYKVWC